MKKAFVSLSAAIADHLHKQFQKLPNALRLRVAEDFSLIPWDHLTANQRRSYATQWDYQHDPAMEADRQYWFDHFTKVENIKRDIARWETIPTPTALDLDKADQKLGELRATLRELEAVQIDARGDLVAVVSDESAENPVGLTEDPGVLTPKDAPQLGSREWRAANAKKAAHAKHSKPGGAWEKRDKIHAIWNSGKFSSKDRCAEEECAALNMSYSAARKALMGLPQTKK